MQRPKLAVTPETLKAIRRIIGDVDAHHSPAMDDLRLLVDSLREVVKVRKPGRPSRHDREPTARELFAPTATSERITRKHVDIAIRVRQAIDDGRNESAAVEFVASSQPTTSIDTIRRSWRKHRELAGQLVETGRAMKRFAALVATPEVKEALVFLRNASPEQVDALDAAMRERQALRRKKLRRKKLEDD